MIDIIPHTVYNDVGNLSKMKGGRAFLFAALFNTRVQKFNR